VTPRARVLLALAAAMLAPIAAPAARAALPPLIPRQELFADFEQDNPEISPDGRWLAWSKRGADGTLNLWVRPLDRDTSWQVTFHRGRGAQHGWWTGDSRGLLFLQDRNGDENHHLWRVDLESGESRDLTPFENVRVEGLFTDPRHPGTVLIGLNRRDPRVFDIHRVDLASGAVTLDTENPGDVIDWALDGEFAVRGATALRASDGATILRVRDAAGAAWREIAVWSMEEAVYDRARKIIAFLGRDTLLVQSWIGRETSALVLVDARSGRELATLAQHPGADLWGLLDGGSVVPQLHLSADGARVQAVAFEHLRVEWKVLDPAVQNDFDVLHGHADGADVLIAGRDREDRRWIVGLMGDRSPGRYLLWDRRTRRATPLFERAPALARRTLAEMTPLMIRASDGLELPCYLTLPPGVAAEKLPLVINPHGGPWFRDSWGWNPEVQWLANRGYAVLQVNFRASSGFGRKLLEAGNDEFGPGRTQQDLVDAMQHLAREGVVDSQRVGIMGWSFGGYATLAGLAFRPELFACGVDVVGPANLRTLIESFPPYWSARRSRWLKRMGDVVNDDALNQYLSPLYSAAAIRAPLLIGHGANDPRVKLAEAEAMTKAMRDLGREVTFLVYPDEGHGFARPENNRDFYGRVDEFLARHLGGRFEPWEKVEGSTVEVR